MKTLALLFGLLFATTAHAQRIGPIHVNVPPTTLSGLSGVALNAAAASRTIADVDTKGWSLLVFYISHTNSAATDVQMACTTSSPGDSVNYPIQVCDVSSGNCTSSDQNHTKAVTGNDEWVWRLDVSGFNEVSCVFSGTSAGGSDLVTVSYRKSTE